MRFPTVYRIVLNSSSISCGFGNAKQQKFRIITAMRKLQVFRIVFSALLPGLVAVATAQAPTPATPKAAAQATPATPPPTQTAKEPEKPKTIDDITKDFVKKQGLFTVYRQQKDNSDTVYLELPESFFEHLMLLQVTAGSGLGDTSAFVFHGQPLGDLPIIFHKQDETHLQLIQPNLDHRGTTVESKVGIQRSFPNNILGTFEIKARQPDRKSALIEVTGFFKSDVGELSQAVDSPGQGYMVDFGSSAIDTVKAFPENIVIRTIYRLMRKSPVDRSPKNVPWAVSFSLSDLPETNYRPRIGDPRVGYFTLNFEDLTDASKYDPNVNYIMRWNLEKADPSSALSLPKKPIVFYIDNAVPQEYRAAVRKGMLMYNEAFEALGIKDAIQVKQMPDDADWDIADLRYNTVRWTTGMPFAIALFRANPVTGEILNACINMDAGFASSGLFAFDHVIDPAAYVKPVQDPLRAKWASRLCDLNGQGKLVQTVGRYAAELLSPPGLPFDKKAYIDQYITEVVAHEMGHCLGLRHNFIASTQFSESQLSNAALVREHGLGESVMDYNPFNTAAIGKTGVDYYSQRIGTYDFWAIDYGYHDIPAANTEGEVPALKMIASSGSLPGHAYQSDGAAGDFDPYVMQFDLSKEPVEDNERMAAIGRKIREKAALKIKPGESYFPYTQAWLAGMNAQLRAASYAVGYVGGGRLSSSFVGDPGAAMPYKPIDAATQRRALKVVLNSVLSDDSFSITPAQLARLSFNPNAPGNEVSARSRLYPLRDRLVLIQRVFLRRILDSDALARIQGNEFRVGPKGDTLTMAELFHDANVAVWSELSSKKPIGDLRRELQRSHLAMLISMALGEAGVPNDARTLSLDQLHSLRARIASAMPQATGEYTKPHLSECLMRIDRALNAHASVPADQ